MSLWGLFLLLRCAWLAAVGVCAAVTGDHLVIAKETARVLGMGSRIYPAAGLPVLGDGGKIPDGLVEEHGSRIIPADGFAAVFPEHKYVFEKESVCAYVHVVKRLEFSKQRHWQPLTATNNGIGNP